MIYLFDSMNFRLWLLSGLALLINTVCVLGQAESPKVTVYTEADGLSSSITRCVLQDSRGLLWIGTPDGLNNYDGYAFKTFRKSSTDSNTIRENFITEITEDQVGDIWIGYLQGGVSCYNISTGVFRHYPLKSYTEKDHIKMPAVTMLFASRKNEIWISTTGNGIFKLDKQTGSYTHINLVNENGIPLPDINGKLYNTAHAACEDEAGILWLATAAGLYRLDPATGQLSINRSPALKPGKENTAHYMCVKKQGNQFWLGSWSGGLASYDPGKDEWRHYSYAPFSPASNVIVDFRFSAGDSITFVSNDRGLGHFNTRSEKFTFPKNNSSIPAGDYKSIYPDKASNIWITSNKGLIKIRGAEPKFSFNQLPVAHSANGNFHNVSATFEDDEYLIIGTSYSDGLYVVNKATGLTHTLAFETLPGEEKFLLVTDILKDAQGTIWVLTRDYLYYLDLGGMQLKKRSQPALPDRKRSNYLFRLQEDKAGNLWIASLRQGLFLYNKRTNKIIRHYSPQNSNTDFIPTTYVSAIHCDSNGDIWIGGGKGFLGRINTQNNQLQTYQTYFPEKAVNINTIYDIAVADKDTLWAGTDAGVVEYKIHGNTVSFQTVYTSEDGISSDLVKSIAKSDDGTIWCLTETSLCRLNPCTGIVASYGFDDGLENPGIGERIQRAGNKAMILGTLSGYYKFDPVKIANMQQTTPILITSFSVNGQQRNYTSELTTSGVITLAPSETRFSFEFTSVNFDRFTRQRYAYMLDGTDTGWTNTINRNVSYANLKPGSYTFKVRAIGSMHQKDSETIVVPLQITGYYYKSTWFSILVAVLLTMVLYLIYKIRLRHQKHLMQLQSTANMLEKEKALILYENLKQQLNPHFLFNSLTSLSSLIRINQKLAGEFLDGLSNTYRYILNSRDKDLVPLSEEIRFCEIYIKLQKTRFQNALLVRFEIKEEHLHLKLPAVTLQNMLENAIKHNVLTEEDPLHISISTNESEELVISNTLNKKPFVETSNRKGLDSLRALYAFLTKKPISVAETNDLFTIKIPLI